MKKKKQSKTASQATKGGLVDSFKAMKPQKQRRFLVKCTVGVLVAGLGGGAVWAYDKNQRELHDLSVIGNGSPVVVQVHDTSCSVCRQLKSRSQSVLSELDHIQFRLADIHTLEGKAFQDKYQVEKTTLILLDERGRHVQTVQGLHSLETLQSTFEMTFAAPS